MADALVTQLARALNLSPDAARHTLNHLVATLREQIETTGEAAVPGLGTFHWEDDHFVFTPEDALARAVNHRYAGLRPIGAGPAATRAAPRPPEPEDPFAAELPSAYGGQRDEPEPAPEAEPPPPAEFQPLETFIEPDQQEEVEAEPEEPSADVDEPVEELAEPEPPELDLPSDESTEEREELVAEEEPLPESEPVPEEEAAIDALLAGTWTSASETPDEEHALGPMPDDQLEDADFAVVEQAEEEPDVEFDAARLEQDNLEGYDFEEDDFEEDDLDEEEWAEADAPPAEEVPAALAADPPPVLEPDHVEESDYVAESEESAEARPLAPAVAATSAAANAATTGRRPAERPRAGNTRLLVGTAAALLLGIVALLWFLNREPSGPTVAERQPVPADTSAALPPPVDTMVAGAATETTAVAEAPPQATPPEADPPETTLPGPPADPLRSTAGIDPASGGWTWVVASDADRATAEQRVARYRAQGLRTGVIAGDAGGRTRYRVGLGQFATTDEANRFRSDLPPDVPEGTWLLQL